MSHTTDRKSTLLTEPQDDRLYTWDKLVEAEPELEDLMDDLLNARAKALQRAARGREFRGVGLNWTDQWTGSGHGIGVKARLQELVGWGVDDDYLGTTEAYDLAYRFLEGVFTNKKDFDGVEWRRDREARLKREKKEAGHRARQEKLAAHRAAKHPGVNS